ncbi:ribonuclease Z, mitochondrial isoform X2 [Agrilus planipennis]|uniref:Zinc phosphodiesterase ELAC protein 2 n=1 Tax=Agrilus planipennis TaxID=224129 RepID=A0A1W4XGD1_AGRPL|nr:ribonuclease Z, mitochondrial isoform X2 [Agrilus planipennis]
MFHFPYCNYCRTLFALPLRFYSTRKNSNLEQILISMPKDPKHISEAQKQRKKIKEKLAKYVPGRVTLQVLGTGAPGAPRSLYVFSDQSRYLFNCGEGTQRLAHEHKMKLSKLEHIFVTQPLWRNIGGLPGVALTIQDVGVPQITLHGPQGLEEIFTATRRFVIIRDLQIDVADTNGTNIFEDSVMAVQYVPLLRYIEDDMQDGVSDLPTIGESIEENSDNHKSVQMGSHEMSEASTSTRSRRSRRRSRSRQRSPRHNSAQDFEDDDTDYYAHEPNRPASPIKKLSDISRKLQETKEEGISMAYICRLKPRPGALCLEKCVQYGVPAGPLLGKLKSGNDVLLEDGTLVRSVDVCEPNDPGPIFIVIDCPSEDYIDSLLNNDRFRKHQAQATCDEDVAYLVVHFTPKNVMENPRYQYWMEQFTPSTFHLAMNDLNTCMGSISVHRIQYKLNLLSNRIFPLLGDRGTECIQEENISEGNSSIKRMKVENGVNSVNNEGKTPPLITADSLEKLSVKSVPPSPTPSSVISPFTFFNMHLRPRKGIDRSGEIKLTPEQYIEECMAADGFSEALNELQNKLLKEYKNITIAPYPKIIFLGTGSCIPNKTRNTSGILLQINEYLNVLLDCGEGTYGQIVRFFGKEKADVIVANTRAVYISHLHADHHIGLIGFLQGRKRALCNIKTDENPIFLLAPRQIIPWLTFYDKCFENINTDYEIVPNNELLFEDHRLSPSIENRLLSTLNMSTITTCFVRHCPNAFGVSFQLSSGKKITYSGDTMPSNNLIKIGMNSDLLIHEATMEDELAEEAVFKMHSTTSQAISIGEEMQAKFIMLTHFSQRYAKLPRFNENITSNVGIAFDNMQVCLDELPLLHHFYPILRMMFAEHCEELENKAVKRQLRMERKRDASRNRSNSPEKVRELSPQQTTSKNA